jgi:hypothetical protein
VCRNNDRADFDLVELEAAIGAFALGGLYLSVDFFGELVVDEANSEVFLDFRLHPGDDIVSLALILNILLDPEVERPFQLRTILMVGNEFALVIFRQSLLVK